jgi:hypothetical protein
VKRKCKKRLRDGHRKVKRKPEIAVIPRDTTDPKRASQRRPLDLWDYLFPWPPIVVVDPLQQDFFHGFPQTAS